MATADVEQIQITNLGPIRQASIPYLPDGGIVVLRGPQGVGKSITLDALQSAATGKGKAPLRDKAGKGEVKAFGVTMKLGARTTRSGEPEVVSIEGKLSVADVVDPGIADPAAADAKRIKALVQLAGGEADSDLFINLFGGDIDLLSAIVREGADEETDLILMAEKIKRDCEKAARDEEKAADSASGRAAALKQTAEGVDTAAETDSEKLQAGLVAAMQAESEAKAARNAYLRACELAETSRAELAKHEGANESLADVAHTRNQAISEADAAQRAVEELEAKLKAARETRDAKEAAVKLADANLRAATERVALLDGWRKTIADAEAVKPVTAEDVGIATEALASARNAMEAGVAARKAIANLASAKEAEADAEKHASAAKTLRTIASKTDDVLSAQVAKLGTPLRVEAGRLLLDTERGPTYFGDLSDGQRWKLALDVAIDAIGEHGLIVIPQWAWGELQPANRKAIAERLKERSVLAYTAEATDGEGIEASVYE